MNPRWSHVILQNLADSFSPHLERLNSGYRKCCPRPLAPGSQWPDRMRMIVGRLNSDAANRWRRPSRQRNGSGTTGHNDCRQWLAGHDRSTWDQMDGSFSWHLEGGCWNLPLEVCFRIHDVPSLAFSVAQLILGAIEYLSTGPGLSTATKNLSFDVLTVLQSGCFKLKLQRIWHLAPQPRRPHHGMAWHGNNMAWHAHFTSLHLLSHGAHFTPQHQQLTVSFLSFTIKAILERCAERTPKPKEPKRGRATENHWLKVNLAHCNLNMRAHFIFWSRILKSHQNFPCRFTFVSGPSVHDRA